MRIRRRTMILAAAGLMTACGASMAADRHGSDSMTTSSETTHAAIVRRVYEQCINAGRLELLDDIVAPELVGPNGETGAAGLRATFAAIRVAFPDIHYTLVDLFADGDRVAVRWTWEGTHTAPIRGYPASGARVKDSGMAIYGFAGGKIRSVWLQTDRLGFLQQIGVVPDDATLRANAARE